MNRDKLTNNFYTKEEIRQYLILYVRLPPRKKRETRTALKKEEEAKANELLAWYDWWDNYHQ